VTTAAGTVVVGGTFCLLFDSKALGVKVLGALRLRTSLSMSWERKKEKEKQKKKEKVRRQKKKEKR